MTYSERMVSAIANASFEKSGLNTICTTPSRSRRSIKINPPKSRRFCTHPFKIISCPIYDSVTKPQYVVLLSIHYSPLIYDAMSCSFIVSLSPVCIALICISFVSISLLPSTTVYVAWIRSACFI